jgi:hypothetical protein
VGAPLLDLAVISLKNGYSKCHAMGLLDKPNAKTKYELEKWLTEVKKCWRQSGAYAWMIIHRRTGRANVVYMPWSLFRELSEKVSSLALAPYLSAVDKNAKGFYVLRLDTFLKAIKPEVITKITKRV